MLRLPFRVVGNYPLPFASLTHCLDTLPWRNSKPLLSLDKSWTHPD